MVNWSEVLQRCRHGNPAPPRVVTRSAAEWQARLGPEQFAVMVYRYRSPIPNVPCGRSNSNDTAQLLTAKALLLGSMA